MPLFTFTTNCMQVSQERLKWAKKTQSTIKHILSLIVYYIQCMWSQSSHHTCPQVWLQRVVDLILLARKKRHLSKNKQPRVVVVNDGQCFIPAPTLGKRQQHGLQLVHTLNHPNCQSLLGPRPCGLSWQGGPSCELLGIPYALPNQRITGESHVAESSVPT